MVRLEKVCKSFEGKTVLRDFSAEFAEGCWCLMAPSGAGKTTLLRLIGGLETPDAGRVEAPEGARFGVVFQEDRLCQGFSPIQNLRLVCPRERAERLLAEILPLDCLGQPVRELSGGMRRRVAVARAMAAESDILLMDEPFTGLDPETRKTVMEFVLRHRQGRLLVAATHQEEEAAALGGRVVRLPASYPSPLGSGRGSVERDNGI